MGIQQRLLLGLLAALLLIALVAYVEGRSVVRTVSSIANAANAIARGKYDERVPVRGRDELAKLGNAFNQMADQLQFRLEELESERHRLREAVSRFGDALAATHDTDQLLRAIVETAVEATGATGGMLIGVDGEVVEVGTPGTGSDQLELAPAGEQEHVRDALPLRPSLRRGVAPDGRVARRPVGDRARQREAAPDRRASGAGGRHDRPREPAPGRRHARGRALARLPLRRPLSVVIGDLDDFKRVNDAHGHGVGDTVLREFAHLLERSVRDVDVASRWGGEEFLLILPGTDAEGAVQLAQRVRDYLEDTDPADPRGGARPGHGQLRGRRGPGGERAGRARCGGRRGPLRGQTPGEEPGRPGTGRLSNSP